MNPQNKKCPSCGSCGIPMLHASDFGGGSSDSEFCSFCSDDNGDLVARFEDVVEFYKNEFIKRRGIHPNSAFKLATEMVRTLPNWASK
jgi:hypothetical protein